MIVDTYTTHARITTFLANPDRFVTTTAHPRSGDLASCIYPGTPDDLTFFDADGVVVLHMRFTSDSGTGFGPALARGTGGAHSWYWAERPTLEEAHAAVVALVDAGELAPSQIGRVAS